MTPWDVYWEMFQSTSSEEDVVSCGFIGLSSEFVFQSTSSEEDVVSLGHIGMS